MEQTDDPIEATHDLMTTQEVARWLRCDVRSVYRFVTKHQMPHYRLGAAFRFKKTEIDAWMRARVDEGSRPRRPSAVQASRPYAARRPAPSPAEAIAQIPELMG
jgi:excisionase family DNA binding protein